MKIKLDEKSGMYYRDETMDLWIVREMNCYMKVDFSDKFVVDIGANIGAFSKRIVRQARKVWAFEPERSNFRLLHKNIAGEPNATICKLAVIGEPKDKMVAVLYVAVKANRGLNSLRPKRGYDEETVGCISMVEIFASYPEIIKMDIEGGEYEILESCPQIPDSVEAFLIEFHFLKKGDRERYAAAMKNFKDHGFSDTNNSHDTGKNLTTVAILVRGKE